MIIARSPLRISLGGGGTDLPSYYRRFGGFVLAAALDRYVYITVHTTFVPEIIVKYSRLERVASVDEIKHPIIREALRLLDLGQSLEITSMADIPAGTGLGSSGSFTTALLKALYAYRRRPILAEELAREACAIEIERLGEPIGKQDQYISAFGGLMGFEFRPDDTVEVAPLRIDAETLYNLEDNLLLFFTGYTRPAGTILREQDTRSRDADTDMLENLHHVKKLGLESRERLERGDLVGFGQLMNEHWQHKKQRGEQMTNPDIDRWYELALRSGAAGGKLVGAGGGGFLMFYATDKTRLRHALRAEGLREVRFRFDFEGSKIVVS
ncbi:MAG: galactokinase [Candidatus Rokuibacteriota bacterium]